MNDSMQAVQLVKIGQPLEQRRIPVPDIGEKDVLVNIKAAGICHSDVHYRAGTSPVGPLPQTLGHEVAGIVERVGSSVLNVSPGDRVCLHYLLTCGRCAQCVRGREQFCSQGAMIGKDLDGGYAQYIAVPAKNAVPLPASVGFEAGAVLMCSSATSFHALRKADLRAGETAAVFGVGGLGVSAIQLALAFGARRVYAVDINAAKLALSEKIGAVPIDAAATDPVAEIMRLTRNAGVDVSLEVIGLPKTMRQALRVLGISGRAALAGITDASFEVYPYKELLGKEATVVGCADHRLHELPLLLDFVQQGRLDLSAALTRTIPLDAVAVNQAMDDLEGYGGGVRTVILP